MRTDLLAIIKCHAEVCAHWCEANTLHQHRGKSALQFTLRIRNWSMDCGWTIGSGVDCVPENDFVADFDACLGIYVAWDGECWGGVGSSPVFTAPKSPIAYQIYGCFCLLYFFELVVEKMNSGCTKIGR